MEYEQVKVALCLHGLCGGSNDFGKNVEHLLSYKNYQKRLFKHHDVDVFFHTWENHAVRNVVDLYKPKAFQSEKQIIFHNDVGSNKTTNKIHSILSRWYSAKRSDALREEYASANNVKYDVVLLSRFDLVLMTDFLFENLEDNALYFSGGWGGHNTILDLWFYAKTEVMHKYCQLYDMCSQFASNKNGEWCPHNFSYQMYKHLNLKPITKFEQFKDFTLERRVYETQYNHITDKSKIEF